MIFTSEFVSGGYGLELFGLVRYYCTDNSLYTMTNWTGMESCTMDAVRTYHPLLTCRYCTAQLPMYPH